MYTPRTTDVNRPIAMDAAALWEIDPLSIEHIADFGNSVYRARRADQVVILRLTDPHVRSANATSAELEFIRHLDWCGVPVSRPLASQHGRWLESISLADQHWLASVFTFAPGVVVERDSPYWEEPFFRAWGQALGRMHRAACQFEPQEQARRWHWFEEDLIAQAHDYLPPDDVASRQELERVLALLQALPRDAATYGLIHADFGPRNFHYHPDTGITAFDFGNCCYHWFISDIAIALSTLRHYPPSELERYRTWLLAGYAEVYPIDPALIEQLAWFIRLRIVYVYLDRLALFGPQPSPAEQQILQTLRQQIQAGARLVL